MPYQFGVEKKLLEVILPNLLLDSRVLEKELKNLFGELEVVKMKNLMIENFN